MLTDEKLKILNRHIENYDNTNTDELSKSLDLLKFKSDKGDGIRNYLVLNRDNFIKEKEKFYSLIVENKFHKFDWQIIMEDSSSITSEISQIKILIKLSYFNLPTLEEKELNLVLDEKSFEEFYEECKKIQKNL